MFDLFDPSSGHQVFKNFSVYSQGAKWGNAAKATADIAMSGGEPVFENGIFIGYIWAPVESALSVESFVPVGGKKYQHQVLRALAQGQYVFVTVGEIGGMIFQFGHMVVKSAKADTDMRTGGLILHCTFAGGSPQLLQSTAALPLRLAL